MKRAVFGGFFVALTVLKVRIGEEKINWGIIMEGHEKVIFNGVIFGKVNDLEYKLKV